MSNRRRGAGHKQRKECISLEIVNGRKVKVNSPSFELGVNCLNQGGEKFGAGNNVREFLRTNFAKRAFANIGNRV